MKKTEQTTELERRHHPFSASRLNALAVSPAYTPDPERETAEAAERGTFLHACVERALISGDTGEVELSDEEAEALSFVLEYMAPLQSEAQQRGQLFLEHYLSTDATPCPEDGHFIGTSGGFVDWLWVDGASARIVDYKFGAWEVPHAEHNLQGWVYALGVFHQFAVQRVTVDFLQARRKQVSTHTFSREKDEARMRQTIEHVVTRARLARKERRFDKCQPTASTCVFCAHRAHCTALWALAADVGEKFAPVEVPDPKAVLETGDPVAAGQALDAIGVLTSWAEGVRATLTQRAIDSEDGWLPNGYRLRRRENYELDAKLTPKVCKELGLPSAVLLEATSYKITPLLNYVSKEAQRGGKEAAKENLRAALRDRGALVEKLPTVFLEKIR